MKLEKDEIFELRWMVNDLETERGRAWHKRFTEVLGLLDDQEKSLAPAMQPAPELTKGNVITLWGWQKSILDSWHASLLMLDQVKPQGVQLHGSWAHLITVAPAITLLAKERGWAVWWGIAGDGDKYNAAERWPRVAEAAQAAGAEAVIINTEAGWRAEHAEDITLAINDMRDYPGLLIGHTSYGQPIWYPEQKFGGFPDFPWVAYCGVGGVDFAHPQVYYEPLRDRYRGYERAWADMKIPVLTPHGEPVGPRRCRIDLPLHIYLACACDPGLTPSPPETNAWIAGQHESISWWALPNHDEQGRLSLLTCCALWNQGYRGPRDTSGEWLHPVTRFQQDHGLAMDAMAGPKTRDALGVG